MSDLTEQQASQAVKISGADTTGAETNWQRVTAKQDAGSVDVITTGGQYKALTVGTSAVLAIGGSAVLTDRKFLSVYNNSSNTMYWGWDSSVTTSTGTPILKNQQVVWSISDQATVYLISTTSSNEARVSEGA